MEAASQLEAAVAALVEAGAVSEQAELAAASSEQAVLAAV